MSFGVDIKCAIENLETVNKNVCRRSDLGNFEQGENNFMDNY